MGGNPTTEHVNEVMSSDVAEAAALASIDELRKVMPDKDTLIYIRNDAYIGDISAILGTVYYEYVNDDAMRKFYVSVNADVDPASKITTPQTRSEFIVDSKIAGDVKVLSFLSSELSREELFEVRIVDNATARFIERGEIWDVAISKWLQNPHCEKLIADPKVGKISVVTGAVQKYLTVKKFKKFEVGIRGGAFGVNVGGSLYTSTTQFDLKIVFGLDLITFKEVTDPVEFSHNVATANIVRDPIDLEVVRRKLDRLVEESTQNSIVKSRAVVNSRAM